MDDIGDGAARDDDALDKKHDPGDETTKRGLDLVEVDPGEDDPVASGPATEAASTEKTTAAASVAAGPTVLERMQTAGINDARARKHLERGWVYVDGQVVTDPDHDAASGPVGHPAPCPAPA